MPDELISLLAIGERIKEERTRLSLSVSEFASATGVSDRSQRNYENGERLPDAGYLARAKEIDVDVDYVLTGERSAWKSLADEIEEQCDRVETVVRVFEEGLAIKGTVMEPDQKARCIRWLYRSTGYGFPINEEIVGEFLATLQRSTD